MHHVIIFIHLLVCEEIVTLSDQTHPSTNNLLVIGRSHPTTWRDIERWNSVQAKMLFMQDMFICKWDRRHKLSEFWN